MAFQPYGSCCSETSDASSARDSALSSCPTSYWKESRISVSTSGSVTVGWMGSGGITPTGCSDVSSDAGSCTHDHTERRVV